MTEARRLSFGMGVHYRLGAPLARLEAQTAFTALLRRFTHIERAPDRAEWNRTFLLRRLDELWRTCP